MALTPMQMDDVSNGSVFTKSSAVQTATTNLCYRQGHIVTVALRLDFASNLTAGQTYTVGTVSVKPTENVSLIAMLLSTSDPNGGRFVIKSDGEVILIVKTSGNIFTTNGCYYV